MRESGTKFEFCYLLVAFNLETNINWKRSGRNGMHGRSSTGPKAMTEGQGGLQHA
jgi:hypothetical protein